MTRGRWTAAVVMGLVGYGVFAWLYPRLSPVAGWRDELSRARASKSAEAVASRLGIDVHGWTVSVAALTADTVQATYSRVAPPELDGFVPPVHTNVLFTEPRGPRRLMVRFGMKDRPLGLMQEGFSGRAPAGTSNADIARAALSSLFDDQDQKRVLAQQPVASSIPGGGERFVFPIPLTGTSPVTLAAEVNVVDGVAIKAFVTPTFAADYRKSVEQPGGPLVGFKVGGVVVGTILWVAALLTGIWSIVRREADYHSAVGLVLLILVLTSIPIVSGSLDTMRVRAMTSAELSDRAAARAASEAQQTGARIGARVQQGLAAWSPLAFLIVPFWFAGYPLSRRTSPAAVVAARNFFGGRFFYRPVGGAIAAGILFAGVVAAIPYVVVASQLVPDAVLSRDGVDLLVFGSPRPLLASAYSVLDGTFLILFAFASPLVHVGIRREWLARGLFFAFAAFWLATDAPFLVSVPASLATGVLTAALALLIYTRYDLLTLLVANAGARVVIHSAALWVQPSPELSAAGLHVGEALLLVAAAGLTIAWRGRPVDIAGAAAAIAIGSGRVQAADRDRLRAEFSLARQVQDQMLPPVPPLIDGFGLAASCRPAREVGGDLYEFIPLGGSRYLIAVADVSGKGVPAALYMTMTKGLLGAVVEQVQEPERIAWSVNEHLFEACARKVFVTMALGILDIDARTFRYTRAGHNPPVWRRTQRGETQWLRAPGIGLGLVGPHLFNNRTAADGIDLEPGDAIVLYSDGIVEAMNAASEEYGEARLVEAIERADRLDAPLMRDAILADVQAFIGGATAHDDMTLVVLRAAA